MKAVDSVDGFVKGLDLAESFYFEAVAPVLNRAFPGLSCSAGRIGAGSDVLGYDDEVSTDHDWGPRVQLFLRAEDMALEGAMRAALSRGLPRIHRGYSVHFGTDVEGNGVRCMEAAPEGGVLAPRVDLHTVDGYIESFLGGRFLTVFDWLAVSEHRLLGFTSGRLFRDDLGMQVERDALAYYPRDVWMWLMASQWAVIGEERAFMRRCGDRGDELGSRLVCGRILERLGRLCFLLSGRYAPYSKWFGTGLMGLALPDGLLESMERAMGAADLEEREAALCQAQVAVGAWQNGIVRCAVDVSVGRYYGRRIWVVDTDALAGAALDEVRDPQLLSMPLIGKLSEVAGLVQLTDAPAHRRAIAAMYSALALPPGAQSS